MCVLPPSGLSPRLAISLLLHPFEINPQHSGSCLNRLEPFLEMATWKIGTPRTNWLIAKPAGELLLRSRAELRPQHEPARLHKTDRLVMITKYCVFLYNAVMLSRVNSVIALGSVHRSWSEAQNVRLLPPREEVIHHHAIREAPAETAPSPLGHRDA